MKYEIITDISEDGMIIQHLMQDKVLELSRSICDTREASFIQALIKLGWTPPKKPNAADEFCTCGYQYIPRCRVIHYCGRCNKKIHR